MLLFLHDIAYIIYVESGFQCQILILDQINLASQANNIL